MIYIYIYDIYIYVHAQGAGEEGGSEAETVAIYHISYIYTYMI